VEKRFILNRATRDMDNFKAFAKEAAKLKAYGRVLVDISALADKAFHELPEGGSSWHEYAVNNAALHRVFPHPKLVPHLPMAWVKKNQELLLAKSAVLRKLGLEAAFHANEPHYWPESFWREHPHLRGPRVDHPRRGRQEEFSVCVDLPEGAEMIEWMMCELKKNIPELGAFTFNANDAGSGFCWADALYPGPNGPRQCRHLTAGERVKGFIETLHRGAQKGGGDLTVYIGHCNFWHNEIYDVVNHLPPDSYVINMDKTSAAVHGLTVGYPALGLVDPLAVLHSMERFDDPAVGTFFLRFAEPYHHSKTGAEAVTKALEIVTDCIERPVRGLRARLERLHEICERWGGKENAETLTEALYDMDQAFKAKQATGRAFRIHSRVVSTRYLTRPLVIKPERLSAEEESYFLPHVFNKDLNEARMDYIDAHGGRIQVGSGGATGIPSLLEALDELRRVATVLESNRKAPGGEWLFQLATAVRIYISEVRSMYNFYFGQLIRDKHKEELSGEPRTPVKVGSWTGEGEILQWNELMRDEFDNANELLALLEERGTDQIAHAEDERHQDCFVLGPDLIGDLKKKVKIMRDHWLDVQDYLAPPHK